MWREERRRSHPRQKKFSLPLLPFSGEVALAARKADRVKVAEIAPAALMIRGLAREERERERESAEQRASLVCSPHMW